MSVAAAVVEVPDAEGSAEFVSGPDGTAAELADIVRGMVEQLDAVSLRYVLAAVLSRRARRRSGLRLLLSVDALQVCQQGDGSAVTPEAYEEWRRRQARPDEYPSERFIRCDSNDGGWAQMQDLAGRRVPWLHRVRQRNSIGGGFTNEQAAAAIRAWIRQDGDGNLAFAAYRQWALRVVENDPDAHIPLREHAFIKRFGGWRAALAGTLGRPELAAVGGRGHPHIPDDVLLSDVRRALSVCSGRLTRGAYNTWAQEQPPDKDGRRPAYSGTVLRRFGRWTRAVETARTSH